ncbi:MAG TPA: ABC transporter substrate-binding protein [Gaiellaceae bacterium]
MKYPYRLSLLVLLLAASAVFTLSACGEKSEPTATSIARYPVSVHDADGRLVSLDARPKSIAVAGEASAELASALALGVTQVGTGGDNLDFSLLRELKPRLLLAGSTTDTAAIKRARAGGIVTYVVSDRTLGGIEQALSDVGLLAGVPVRGRMERKRLSEKRETVQTALANVKPVRVFIDMGNFTTVSDSSFVGHLIIEAGGINVAGPDAQEGPFPLKRLRRLRPEVLIVGSDSDLTVAKLKRNPSTRWIPAVRTGRLVRIDLQSLEPGPKAVDGLLNLATALHPDAFS